MIVYVQSVCINLKIFLTFTYQISADKKVTPATGTDFLKESLLTPPFELIRIPPFYTRIPTFYSEHFIFLLYAEPRCGNNVSDFPFFNS